MNYAEMLDIACKAPKRGKIGNNTYIRVEDDVVIVRLHATDIMKWYPNGAINLFDGGWDTVTTRNRIGGYRPNGYYLAREKGVTYVWRITSLAETREVLEHTRVTEWTGSFESLS